MLTFTIIFSVLISTCFSRILTCPKALFIPAGSCRTINCIFQNKPKNASIQFSGYPQDLIQTHTIEYEFTQTNEKGQEYVACSATKSGPIGQYNITYNMIINNATPSQPQTGTITINIEKPVENTSLSKIIWKDSRVKGTCVELDLVTPYVNSTLYYSIRNVWHVYFYQYRDNLLYYCKEYNVCESQGLIPVYEDAGARESYGVIIEKKKVTSNQTRIVIRNELIEGTHYNICAFYRTDDTKDNSVTTCTQFNTDTSQNMLRARFKFTQNLSSQKSNSFLCFLTKYLRAQILDVINIQGKTCNQGYPFPDQPYFRRMNSHEINNANQTIVYVSRGCAEADNRILEPNWNNMWDGNGNISPMFRWVLNQNGMNWVESGKNLGGKNMGEMLKPKDINARFKATKKKTIVRNQTMFQYKIYNITSQSRGIVYFIQMTFMFQNGGDPSYIPTTNQTIQCDIGMNQSIIVACSRAVLTGPTTQQPQVLFLVPEQYTIDPYAFKMFYVEAGEYPKIPIASWKEVKEVEFEDGDAEEFLRANRRANGG